MKNPKREIAENGSPFDLYKCPNCGNNVGRFISRNGGSE
jgi:hypothetical protein